ncbi:hypothetical protein LWI29_000723 [Acer saccharum]|uniref:Uncharacterized protein n=1 Tax=Acer saccharum TaxID=4024 RepID=A0AA39VHB9_ACESA|nr:hypothetical protein LWI29_000723 [Acer saccharum]
MVDDNGVQWTDGEHFEGIISKYFIEIFSSSQPSREHVERVVRTVDARITDERYLSPLAAIPLVTLTGLGLYALGFPQLAKCIEIGLPALIVLVLLSQYLPHLLKSKRGIIERFAVLGTIAIVWGYAEILTAAGAYDNKSPNTQLSCRTDRSGLISAAPWIRIPYPFQWGGPSFNAGDAFAMMAASFVAIVESTGTFIAASRYGSATPMPPSVLSRGIGWQGIGILLDGAFGTGSGTTASVSVGINTKWESESCSNSGRIYAFLFGKFGAVLASIPLPIVAALYCVLFGYVVSAGLSFLQFCNLNSFRTKFIIGFSLFMGLSVPQYFSGYLLISGHGPVHSGSTSFNDIVQVIFSSPATVAILVAFLLDCTHSRGYSATRLDSGRHWWVKFRYFDKDTRSEEFYSLPMNLNRSVICIDATHLKARTRGVLLVVVCKDGNGMIYPLTFGFANSECTKSWTWFLKKLRKGIQNLDRVMLVLDRHNGIFNAMEAIFPDAAHGICAYHLAQNLKRFCKQRDDVIWLYYCAAYAYRIEDFDNFMGELKETCPKLAIPTDLVKDSKQKTLGSLQKSLPISSGPGSALIHGLRVAGPPAEPTGENQRQLIVVGEECIGPGLIASGSKVNTPDSSGISARPLIQHESSDVVAMVCSSPSQLHNSPKRAPTRNWKRLAREKKSDIIQHNSSSLFRKLKSVYASGSGQQINFQKSKVTFSSNVLASTKEEIFSLLGIADSRIQDQYLGLPSMVGRNKRIMFNEIKERVWKKLRGWKDSYFSFGGKEVLIRAVAQTIPNYAMSIFQLPMGLCKELSAMFSKFWWGSREGKRKISWVKWVAAKKGSSHVWRSILWGRSLLQQGLRWVVGNGQNIRVFRDRWLPRPSTFSTITSSPGSDLRVADLLDHNCRWWDIDKLDRLLLPCDKEIVQTIPVSWLGGEDFLAWHYEKNGEYSVRSGYNLALEQKISASVSNPGMANRWWNILWKLQLPPKVKIFVWRACWNAFPSLQNLWKRKVVVSPMCNSCPSSVETSGHAIFWCKAAKECWRRSDFVRLFSEAKSLSALEVFMKASSHLSIEDMSRFCIIAWAIWDNRNLVLNQGKGKPYELVISGAFSLLAEFQNSTRDLSIQSSSVASIPSAVWLAPPPGKIKINTAAAIRKNGSRRADCS